MCMGKLRSELELQIFERFGAKSTTEDSYFSLLNCASSMQCSTIIIAMAPQQKTKGTKEFK